MLIKMTKLLRDISLKIIDYVWSYRWRVPCYHKTLFARQFIVFECYGRQMNVKTTLGAYWQYSAIYDCVCTKKA